MNPSFDLFKNQITKPVKFRMFMLTKLPSAWFAGLRIVSLSSSESVISVQEKWFNKNPFNSIYFAILSMAAEVSTGILCMGALYKRQPAVSMLVVSSQGSFHKKATGKILFTCVNGNEINEAVERSIATGEGVTVICTSVGTNVKQEVVAEFKFTWSFKAKK